jgi:predicted Zn-dependent protease
VSERRKACLFALCALLAAAPTAASAANSLPAPGYKPLANSTEGGLWAEVDQVEKHLQQSPLVIRDDTLNAYVKKVVCDLAGPQCASIRVYLVDAPMFNAACYPNGMMTVYTGLLLRTENEAQLAFVLGHELTHYLKRHTLDAFETRRNTATALAFLSLGVAGVGVGTGVNMAGTMDLVQLSAIGALFSYSRDQEREADAGGFDAAVARGYDPRQAAMIWGHMEEEEAANPRRSKPIPFFADHPTNKERLVTMGKRGEEMEKQSHAEMLEAKSYREAILPHRAQWLDEELNRGEFDESLVLIRRLIAAENDPGELNFYLGEVYRRRNAKGDLESAMAAYNKAIGGAGAPAAAYRGLGLAALKSGKKDVARGAFQEYLTRVPPDASDREIVQFYLTSAGGPP